LLVSRFGVVASMEVFKRSHSPWHAFAVADTAFAAYFNFQNAFPSPLVNNDHNVSKLKASGFVWSKTSIRHE
jgi:hypothetical protein